ncbi:hypothetical protein ACQP0C_42030 (plasmid) [Nocardia sp. CA-129566]|uniref:hypothetical protein n=1 Tax=Nocardia sp. CA-129566 TaxID=3239976 RepID=UPI003D97A7CF
MSRVTIPPDEQQNHPPANPHPPGTHPLVSLAAAMVAATPVGLLTDWSSAVPVFLTVFTGLLGIRQVCRRE